MMTMIGAILSSLFATLVLFPFIVTFVTLVIYKKIGSAPKSKLGIAADLTTPFLLLSVYILSRTIFGVGVGYTMLTAAILMTIAFAIYERVNVKEFRVVRLLRKIWRLLFLLLVFFYFALLILGLVLRIVEYLQ